MKNKYPSLEDSGEEIILSRWYCDEAVDKNLFFPGGRLSLEKWEPWWDGKPLISVCWGQFDSIISVQLGIKYDRGRKWPTFSRLPHFIDCVFPYHMIALIFIKLFDHSPLPLILILLFPHLMTVPKVLMGSSRIETESWLNITKHQHCCIQTMLHLINAI